MEKLNGATPGQEEDLPFLQLFLQQSHIYLAQPHPVSISLPNKRINAS